MREEEPTRRYAIRKLTVGAASVLIGLTFLNAKPTTVHADTVNDDAGQSQTDANTANSTDNDASQSSQTAQVVKTTAPQNSNQNNSNLYTVSKHDAFFSGSGLSGDAFTRPNTKPDAKTGWETPETPDYNTNNNQANSNTNAGNTANVNNNQNNVVQNSSTANNNQNSTSVTVGNNTPVSNNTSVDNTANNTNSKNQANRNVQDNIGNTGDVQGNGTVEKSENVRYVDRDTGKDITDSSNVNVDFVPYFKRATGTITYRDAETNQVLGTQTIHGYVGGQVTITTGQLEGYVNQGYKISSDSTINQRFIDGTNTFTIDLNHNVITQGGRTVDTSQTVHFVDENGNDLVDPKVQSDTFVYTPTITDKVTGDVTLGGKWNMVDKTFDDVEAPVIPGYLATVKSIKGAHTTIDNPIASSVITYKQLGHMIPVVHNDNMGDDTGVTDTNQKSTIEISTAQPVYYTVDPKDPTKILTEQTAPDIDGYVPVNPTITVTDPFKDIEVVYIVDQNYQAYKGDKQTVHEIINYVGPDGKSIWPKTDNSFDFLMKNGQSTNADDHTFTIVYPPVIDGYVADQSQIDNVTVKPDDKNKIFTVKYAKIGNIVAVDENGKELKRVQYQNNPYDASAVLDDETPPEIDGYTPKDQTISPVFPDQDTRVVYVKNADGKHITINFVDSETGGNILSKTLTGVAGTPCTYNPASDIAYVRAQGYSLGDDLVPDNLVFGNEDLTYNINFGHKSIQLDPDSSAGFVDGGPVDPSSPYGAKGQIYDWKRTTKHTVHYTGAGAATPKDVVQKNTWTRHFTIDEVTGAKTIIDDWQSSLGDNYSDVGTPVVQTYHADKQRIPTRRIKLNSDLDDTVSYKRNGRMILDFYDQNGVKLKTKKGPYWITDPGDPTAIMPNEKVPMFTDYVPMVRMITPETPEKDTHVVYIHVPDKIIVPVVPPDCPPPTAAMVVAAAEAQIGKPIEHPVIIAKNKITKPSDLVYAYDETTGSQIGDNVKANWRKLQRRGSYYNNTQEGYDGKFFTKQTAADVNDRLNTPKSLNDGEQHDLTEAQYDSYHNGRQEDTEIKDEAKDKGITLQHKDGDDITEIMFNKINHTEQYKDNTQFRNTDLPDISNQVWENNKWNTDDFGNHYNPSPADTLGASAVAMFALPSSINNINDAPKANVQNLMTNLAETPSKNAIPVNAKTQALKVKFNKNGDVTRVQPLAVSLAVDTTGNSSNADSHVGGEDWEPTPFYAVVINGKVVQTGLTKDQMEQYVAKHKLPDISGYTPDTGQDTGITYQSPDSSTKIIYYHKTGTRPGDNITPDNPNNPSNPDHGNTNPDNPNNPDRGNTDPDNPNNPDHGNTDPDNPNNSSNPDHGNTNPDNPNKPSNPNHGNTNPDNPNNPSNPDHGNTNPDNPNNPSNPDHGNTNPDNPNNPSDPNHGNTNPDNPNNPSNPDHGNTSPDSPNNPSGSDHGNTSPDSPNNPSGSDHGNTNPDSPNNPSGSDHGNTSPDSPNNPSNPDHGNTSPNSPNNPSGSDHGNTSPDNPNNPSDPNNPVNPDNPNNNGQNNNQNNGSNNEQNNDQNQSGTTINNGAIDWNQIHHMYPNNGNNGNGINNNTSNGSNNGSNNSLFVNVSTNGNNSNSSSKHDSKGHSQGSLNDDFDSNSSNHTKNSSKNHGKNNSKNSYASRSRTNKNASRNNSRGRLSNGSGYAKNGGRGSYSYGRHGYNENDNYSGNVYGNSVNGANYSTANRYNRYGATSAYGYDANNGSYDSFVNNGYSYAETSSSANTGTMNNGYSENGTVYANTVNAGERYNSNVVATDASLANSSSALSAAQAQYRANSGYLPQTGSKQSLAVIALGMVLISTSFGLAVKRRN